MGKVATDSARITTKLIRGTGNERQNTEKSYFAVLVCNYLVKLINRGVGMLLYYTCNSHVIHVIENVRLCL